MGTFSKDVKDEKELLRIARFACRYSPGNILLIGGGCVLAETAGFRRMRALSDDLDFIVNEQGLDAIRKPLNLGDFYKNGEHANGGNVNYINDVLVCFFHKEIRGWKIPESVFEKPRIEQTSVGEIYMIPAELNLALKIRRGASKNNNPHIYGKDALDAASIFLGIYHRQEKFDINLFSSYLLDGVCSDCKLSRHEECTHDLRESQKQLFGEDKKRYCDFMDACGESLDQKCTKCGII